MHPPERPGPQHHAPSSVPSPGSAVAPPRARRRTAALALVLAVAAGLGVVRLPQPWGDMGGDLVYAVAVYAAIVLVLPRMRPVWVAVVAVSTCWVIELAQATGLVGVVVDAVPAARWVLGTTFAVRDLVLYAVGGVLALLVDRGLVRLARGSVRSGSGRSGSARSRPQGAQGVDNSVHNHPQAVEEVLAGGNSTAVVRVGDRVHRTAGPWTPTIHGLLDHLHERGVDDVPVAHGTDDQGREVVSYLPGDVAHHPLPAWLWTTEVLVDSARWLRRFHDAGADYATSDRPTLDAADRDGPTGPAASDTTDRVWRSPVHEPVEVVCHNDVAPYNMVFRDGRLVGVIDLDTASPGPRVWDLAYLAYRLAPFAADAFDGADDVPDLDPLARLDALVDAYGMPFARADVLATMADRLDELALDAEGRAATSGPPELREHAAMYRADAERLRALRP
ncbi:DUF2809 domain-containing protein [Sediminihabitans luteus]|uniref:DUF2809 domain-containing protein n=1 Tax=Sediminihabitans luteus TaxID=1138585 RepID=UPI0012FDF9CC|nr:DUF2809 domain-containing protein [Sediminihabitans luteus]